MSNEEFHGRRRFTLVEVVVVGAIAALLAGIAIPIVLDDDENTEQARAVAQVQEAVRRYHADTNVYPTFGATPAPQQTPSAIWVAGGLPSLQATPAFAGIDFNAKAARPGRQVPVAFVPDYLKQKPRYAGDAAADGTQRWRIDKDGNVRVELDGRSY